MLLARMRPCGAARASARVVRIGTSSLRRSDFASLALSASPGAQGAHRPAAQTVAAATAAALAACLSGRLSSAAECEANASALTPEQLADVTALVTERVQLPLVPAGLQEIVLGQCVQLVADELAGQLTEDQVRRLSQHLAGAADGISNEEREQLTAAIAKKLKVVPLVPDSMWEAIVGIVIDVILGDTTILAASGAFVGGGIRGTAQSLLSEEGRKNLARRINDVVDLPGLSDAQEQVVFEKCISAVGKGLDALVPLHWRAALKGASPAELAGLKDQVVGILDSSTPIPFVDEDTKRLLLRVVVDFSFDSFLDVSGLDGVVLSPEAQLKRLVATEADLQAELQRIRRAGKRRQATLERRITSVREQEGELRRDLGGGGMLRATLLAVGAVGAAAAGIAACIR